MGFGPSVHVVGSLVVSVVAAHTLDHFVSTTNPAAAHSQFYFSGITSSWCSVLALFFLKDLSSNCVTS